MAKRWSGVPVVTPESGPARWMGCERRSCLITSRRAQSITDPSRSKFSTANKQPAGSAGRNTQPFNREHPNCLQKPAKVDEQHQMAFNGVKSVKFMSNAAEQPPNHPTDGKPVSPTLGRMAQR